MHNKPLEPIAAPWAAPAQLFVIPVITHRITKIEFAFTGFIEQIPPKN